MTHEEKKNRLEELILSEYSAMYRLAYSYTGNEHDAMDVVQESILKAFQRIGSLKEPQFMKTWLWRILINTSIDTLKAGKRTLPLTEQPETGSEDTYRDFDTLEALKQLDATERAVVVLRFFEDRKLDEISRILEMNLNSVKTILYRSLRKLKVELKESEVWI